MSTPTNAVELALVSNDLSKLDVNQRLSYYNRLCDSLGLNPLTSPFEYITLNGKLRLYAKKDCTEQLRKIHKVSIVALTSAIIEGVYVVTAKATTADGRSDESTGAVFIQGLKGEALANAFMKGETKAKRRVTLSICGLAFLDESEVESVHSARVEPQVAVISKPQIAHLAPAPIKNEIRSDFEPDKGKDSFLPGPNMANAPMNPLSMALKAAKDGCASKTVPEIHPPEPPLTRPQPTGPKPPSRAEESTPVPAPIAAIGPGPNELVINFGKNSGKKLIEIPAEELPDYIANLKRRLPDAPEYLKTQFELVIEAAKKLGVK